MKTRILPFLLVLALALALAGVSSFAASPDATINISDSSTLPAYGSGWSYDSNSRVLTIHDGADVLLTGSTSTRRVVIATGACATITLQNATITSASASAFELQTYTTAEVTLVLSGTNTLKSNNSTSAGLTVASGAKLIIKGGGSLIATGGGSGNDSYLSNPQGGAGIGGGSGQNVGTIVIQDGVVTATGGSFAAGIGGGRNGIGGSVTINGGTVTATGGALAAGIGGGFALPRGEYPSISIVINGGSVLAKAGASVGAGYKHACLSAAGIGGGCLGAHGIIIINGGSVSALGGTFGAGIGAGSGAEHAGSITINGGVVTADAPGGLDDYWTVRGGGAGIGGGGIAIWNNALYYGSPAGDIAIRGGVVVAIGRSYCPGIGGGPGATSGRINISGGTIIAYGQGIGIAPATNFFYYDVYFSMNNHYLPPGWTTTTINNDSGGAANNAVVFATAVQNDNSSVVIQGNGKVIDSTEVTFPVGGGSNTLTLKANIALPASAELTIPAGCTLSNPSPHLLENHGTIIVTGTLANAGGLYNAGEIVVQGALTNSISTGTLNNVYGGAILIPVEVRGLSAVNRTANGSREVSLIGTPVLYPANPIITGISLTRPPLSTSSLVSASYRTGMIENAAAGSDKPVTTNIKLTGNLDNYYLLLQPDNITVTITAGTGTGGNGGTGGGSSGGGGGGGAPSLIWIGAIVALLALRGAKRK